MWEQGFLERSWVGKDGLTELIFTDVETTKLFRPNYNLFLLALAQKYIFPGPSVFESPSIMSLSDKVGPDILTQCFPNFTLYYLRKPYFSTKEKTKVS